MPPGAIRFTLSVDDLHALGIPRDLDPNLIAELLQRIGTPKPKQEQKHPCRNCLDIYHKTKHCPVPCGHCGQDWHNVDACTSSKRNRCRCSPFPQRHLAKQCPKMCTPGECPTFHVGDKITAMMCKVRCCMCGIPGHAGRDCHLKKCRCGGEHLTVDHMPMDRQCVVLDCPRWFCTKHCQACEIELEKLNDEVCRSCGAKQQIRPSVPRKHLPTNPDYEYVVAAMVWGNSKYGKAIFGNKVTFQKPPMEEDPGAKAA
ncbi:hypothetical protein BDP81DRAFT_465635 [Colletotrichum phormii]|uniref:CCHC-type domain-containing protein n=1 Tax=Colletotrichum phormii TaxID=359342 RepID=A0AAI9ZGR4_9PEZI|nr:uncharacterized protein BDP81DRAFT_465635 [Colletotrichum phormii]KAK1623151.1 hypothetical protein BDP81DRAFT_465635 [Colletotrichum phormii]